MLASLQKPIRFIHTLLIVFLIMDFSSAQAQTWDFEDQQLGDWVLNTNLEFDYSTSGGISDEQAFSGNYSVKYTVGNDALNGALINDNLSANAGDSIHFHVYVPANQIDHINALQPFVQGNGFSFGSFPDIEPADIELDAWNKISTEIPNEVETLNRVGIQVRGIDTLATATIFVDDIQVSSNNTSGTISIAEARNAALGSQVTVTGIITKAMGSFSNIQQDTAALYIYEPGGSYQTAIANGDVSSGDSIRITGEIDEFEGIIELINISSFQVLSSGNALPDPIFISTIDELLENATRYQSELIRINDLQIIGVNEFVPQQTYTVSQVGTDQVVNMYIPGLGDSELGEKTIPAFFDYEGILGFYTPGSGAQLRPINVSDIIEIDPPEGAFTIPEPPYVLGDTINANGSFEFAELGDTEALAWGIQSTPGSLVEIVDEAADGDNRALRFNVSWNGIEDEWYRNEVTNESINVVEGQHYRFSVYLKADDTTRIARPYIGVPESGGYERARGWETPEVELNTEYEEWSFEWTATADNELHTMRLGIEFNAEVNDGGVIYIDNARVERIELPTISEADSLALVALYDSTGGDNWTNNENWLEGPISDWHGVTVESGKIVGIDLTQNNLVGELPDSFSELTDLSEIIFYRNEELTGDLFSLIADFESITNLRVRVCDFYGTIPAEIGNHTNMNTLYLSSNRFSGGLPDEIGNLVALERLAVADNNMEGGVPETIANLTNLISLNLTGNSFSGEFPMQITTLSSLESLFLGYNNFSGEIPSELGNLSNLFALHLYGNEFTGEIPEELGTLTNINYLTLSENQLTGPIPASFSNLSGLITFNASQNELSGEIPAGIWEIERLERLYINDNNFTGSIPSLIGNLTNLRVLSVTNNNFSGNIPVEITSLGMMEQLLLGGNNFTGELSEFITDLENLHWLSLNDTEVVIPASTRMQAWLGNLTTFQTSGIVDLGSATLVTPSNEEVGQSVPTMFTWSGQEDANQFTIEIYTDEELADTVYINNVSDSWISLGNLEHNTTYYWRINSGTNYGIGEWSEVRSFKTQLSSEVGPELSSPANNAEEVEIPVSFSWGDVNGAQNYYLEISTVPSFDTTETVKQLAGTEFTLEEAVDDTDYFWRVRAEADGASGGWSAVGTFTTELRPPETPTWEPENGAENVPVENTLVWNSSERAETYDIQLATSNSFEELILDETELEETEFDVSLEGETTYFWRVRGVNSSGESEWSPVASFTTEMTTGIENGTGIPDEFAMHQNYPNPFNPSTQIQFDIPDASKVQVEVFSMLGQKVATLVNERKSAGSYQVQFDASNLSSGIYIYRIRAGNFIETKKMTLIK